MGKLHDRLEEIGYRQSIRSLRGSFCFFLPKTPTIFNKQQFQEYLEQRTAEDGSDLAAKLQELFQVLNTKKEYRFKILTTTVDFPCKRENRLEEILPTASFDTKNATSFVELLL